MRQLHSGGWSFPMLVQETATATEPRPCGCELRVVGDARRKQIAGARHGLERAVDGQLFRLHERRVVGLLDAWLADHRHRQAIAVFRDGLDRLAAEDLAQADDHVRQVGIGHERVGPQRGDQLIGRTRSVSPSSLIWPHAAPHYVTCLLFPPPSVGESRSEEGLRGFHAGGRGHQSAVHSGGHDIPN